MMGIYKITNSLNYRFYIGSTNNIQKRKRYHFSTLKANKHFNRFLQHDYNKNKEENFVFEIILDTDCAELLFDFEQSYLNQFYDNQKMCYNINSFADRPKYSSGSEHHLFGKTFSTEHRKKISNALKKSSLASKYYNLIDPDGKELKILNLRKFCKDNNLHNRHIYETLNRPKKYKGWKLISIEDQNTKVK